MGSRSSRGFTLVETLVASAVLAVGLVALAQLGAQVRRGSVVADVTTRASILAGAKLDTLRHEVLTPSPPGTLDRDVAGYADHLDRNGRVAGTGGAPPGGAVFSRRWAISEVPHAPGVWLVRVEVRPRGGAGAPGGARVATLVRGGLP